MKLSQFKMESRKGRSFNVGLPDYLIDDLYYMCYRSNDTICLYWQSQESESAVLEYNVTDKILNFLESDIDSIPNKHSKSDWPLIQFAVEICENENIFLYKVLQEKLPDIVGSIGYNGYLKLAKYIIFEPVVLEKMLKSLPFKVVIEEISSSNDLIKDQGKLSKTMGISTDSLSRIDKLKIPQCLTVLREISEIDRNYVDNLLDFTEIWRRVEKKFEFKYSDKADEVSILTVFEAIREMLNWGYELKPLLNYITKQSLLYKQIGFPKTTTVTLRDYVSMGEDMSAPYEKFPQYLSKAHFIFSRNYNILLDDSLALKFKDAVKKYSKLEIKGSEYSLITPKTIKDLAEEGNALHHCIASYGRKIVNGDSIILFLRKSTDLSTPFVTVEVDEKKRIVQIKTIYDQDVSIDIKKEASKLLKQIA